MKELWSKRCQELTPYTPGEQPKGGKVVKLNTNENPYPPSPKAVQAIREAIADLRLYPDPACTQLREALAQDLGVTPRQVFVGNGSDEVLALAFQAFFDPDRPIRFADITYSFYPVFADFFGLKYEEVPLDDSFNLPLGPFLEPCGGVVIANPNAPTGKAMDFRSLQTIVDAQPDRVVIVDEAYIDFGGRSAVELLALCPNLLVVRTFSKSRALAGLRVGYAIGSEALIAALETVKDSFNSYPVDRLAQAGALGAVRDKEYFELTVRKIKNTRIRTANALGDMGFSVCYSSANFVFARHEKLAGKLLCDRLREKGILVRWWDKPRIRDYLRITIGTDEDMETLCKALEEIIAAPDPGLV